MQFTLHPVTSTSTRSRPRSGSTGPCRAAGPAQGGTRSPGWPLPNTAARPGAAGRAAAHRRALRQGGVPVDQRHLRLHPPPRAARRRDPRPARRPVRRRQPRRARPPQPDHAGAAWPSTRTAATPTPAHPERLRLPILLVQGEQNHIFRPEGTLRTLRWLQAANDPSLYERVRAAGLRPPRRADRPDAADRRVPPPQRPPRPLQPLGGRPQGRVPAAGATAIAEPRRPSAMASAWSGGGPARRRPARPAPRPARWPASAPTAPPTAGRRSSRCAVERRRPAGRAASSWRPSDRVERAQVVVDRAEVGGVAQHAVAARCRGASASWTAVGPRPVAGGRGGRHRGADDRGHQPVVAGVQRGQLRRVGSPASSAAGRVGVAAAGQRPARASPTARSGRRGPSWLLGLDAGRRPRSAPCSQRSDERLGEVDAAGLRVPGPLQPAAQRVGLRPPPRRTGPPGPPT